MLFIWGLSSFVFKQNVGFGVYEKKPLILSLYKSYLFSTLSIEKEKLFQMRLFFIY